MLVQHRAPADAGLADAVSVPSFGSVLVQPPRFRPATGDIPVSVPSFGSVLVQRAAADGGQGCQHSGVSVPSFGSVLVQRRRRRQDKDSALVSVPSFGSVLVQLIAQMTGRVG